ncbi:HK97 gp10 family phage protein [Gilliamella sp. Pas-s95]|uniref:HK97 gp10 family phage protein n=1 Tax=Gilliamella sp. Pas-s95 TaxID=2687317 RepID=UPI001326A06C|nr:HK97 gp10 family phage protein [Gilliamella sp. Pas-s95]MWN05096.1 HK97 gp10 family phage protein [Gilliamella sp. Pas-s95]
MAIKVKGVRGCIKGLDNTVNNIIKTKAIKAMHVSIIVGANQAALYTPIDTSNLVNSQYREVVVNGTRITGRVGYTAAYAAYVADPNHPMKFKRSTAKKDFLNKGFEDVEDQIVNIFKKELFS